MAIKTTPAVSLPTKAIAKVPASLVSLDRLPVSEVNDMSTKSDLEPSIPEHLEPVSEDVPVQSNPVVESDRVQFPLWWIPILCLFKLTLFLNPIAFIFSFGAFRSCGKSAC